MKVILIRKQREGRETIFSCPHTFKFRTRLLTGTTSGIENSILSTFIYIYKTFKSGKTIFPLGHCSCVTEYLFGGGKGGQTFIWGGGGQEDGIAKKGAQSKSQWGGGPWCEWGCHGPQAPPIVTPLGHWQNHPHRVYQRMSCIYEYV